MSVGAMFDPHDPRYVTEGVPFDELADLRRDAPMSRTPQGAWYLASYALVQAALRDTDTYRSDLSVHSGLTGVEQVPHDQRFLSEIDEPRHAQVRKIFLAEFGPKGASVHAPLVDECCRLLVSRWQDDDIVDLHGDFAALVPGLVMARIMGLPDQAATDFDTWSRDGMIMARPCSPHVGEGRHPLQNVLRAELIRRRSLGAGPDDVFRRLIDATIDDGSLSDQEIVTQLHFMIQAGVHTTRGLLTHLTNRLVQDPELAAALRDDVSLIDAFVEESLRHDAPVQRTTRRCAHQARLGDIDLAPGDWLEMGIASANRDEAHFTDVDEFRMDRDGGRHLAFGTGPHVCPGAALARVEGATAVRVLLECFDDLEGVDGAVYPPLPGSLGHLPIPARVRVRERPNLPFHDLPDERSTT